MDSVLGTENTPLLSITYAAHINSGFCKLQMIQKFQNTSNHTLSVAYQFKVTEQYVIDSLTIITPTSTIHAKIMQKEKAKECYEKAAVKGDYGVLCEYGDVHDTLKVLIGQINSLEEIVVRMEFSMFLPIIDESWALSIPVILGKSLKKITKATCELNYEIKIKFTAEVECTQYKLSRLISRNHKFNVTGSQPKYTLTIDEYSAFKSASDILILCKYDTPCQSCLLHESFNGEYAYSVIFTPTYSSLKPTQLDMVQTSKYEDSTLQGSGEYIFLLDRSGSMNGTKIKIAVQSLILFLKSLPIRSKFNIIEFNDRSYCFAPESIDYSEENIENAIKKLEKVKCKGGTELIKSLEFAFKENINPRYPRTIFLLTDGGVKNKEKVVQLIESNRHKAIVHSIGIGNDADEKLIVDTATVGNGEYKIVTNIRDVAESIINLLSICVPPAFSNIVVNWGQDPINEWPQIKSIPYIRMGKPLFICALFSQPLVKDIIIKCLDTYDWKEREFSMKPIDTVSCSGLSKVIAFHSLKRKPSEEVLKLSIKYQLLSSETALFAYVKNANTQQEEATPIQIPMIKEKEKCKKKELKPHLRVKYNTKLYKCKAQKRSRCASKTKKVKESPMKKRKTEENDSENNIEEEEEIDEELFNMVIRTQRINGTWDMQSAVALLKIEKQSIMRAKPSNISDEQWATLLVLALLYLMFKSKKQEWKLIANKAKSSLKKEGINYKDYVKDSNNLVMNIAK